MSGYTREINASLLWVVFVGTKGPMGRVLCFKFKKQIAQPPMPFDMDCGTIRGRSRVYYLFFPVVLGTFKIPLLPKEIAKFRRRHFKISFGTITPKFFNFLPSLPGAFFFFFSYYGNICSWKIWKENSGCDIYKPYIISKIWHNKMLFVTFLTLLSLTILAFNISILSFFLIFSDILEWLFPKYFHVHVIFQWEYC